MEGLLYYSKEQLHRIHITSSTADGICNILGIKATTVDYLFTVQRKMFYT